MWMSFKVAVIAMILAMALTWTVQRQQAPIDLCMPGMPGCIIVDDGAPI